MKREYGRYAESVAASEPGLHIARRGDGEATLLLLHGGGVGGWMWKPVAKHLDASARLLIPDLPGHDHSAHVPYHSHRETVRMLVAMLRDHAASPVTVVGFSLGAQLAVLLAAEHPDLVQNAVVISAQAKPTLFPAATLAMLRAAAPLARSSRFARLQAKQLFVPDSLMDDYIRTSQTLPVESLLAAVRENIRFTIPPGWADFPGRSEVLVGATERRLMHMSARQLTSRNSRSELSIVAGCGHGMPLQRPEWLAHRLRCLF